MGRPISYEMQMMFVGSSGAFEEAMNTGSGISRLDFIQGYDFSFNIERTPLKQIGSDSFATRQTQLAPDVNLNIQYYLNDGWNDKYIGLDIPTGATGNPFDSILSSTGDRNFYISIAQNDGIDQNLQTGIVNSNILAIGNAYITNYEISVAVNQLATVSCSFVGANANVQDYATSKYLPSVNTLVSGQNAQDANKNFSLNFVNNSRTERYLPKAKEVFDGGCPYSKCKITPDFQSGGGTSPITFGFFDAIANNFQSMQFSVQFERKALYGFGNNHPYIRKIQRPTVATLSLSALIDDFQAENLSKVFHAEGGTQKSMLIEFFNFQDVKKFGLSLQNLTLESYNLGARIGDRVLVETNWSVEVKNGAGADIGMIGSYGTPILDTTLVNESFAVERLFYQIDAGASHSIAISKNGRVFGWGLNSSGQLGDDSVTQRLTPVSVFGAAKTFCTISGSDSHSLAIDKNGRAWAWGTNTLGQLGDNSATSRRTPIRVLGDIKTFCQISAATQHSLAIDKNGSAWGWGYNRFGRLGNNSLTSQRTPVSVAGQQKTFCAISAGNAYSFAIDKYGNAWGWGLNLVGQLGDGTPTSRLTPVSVAGAKKTFCKISAGYGQTIAIDKYGRGWGWGYNARGQIGDNSITCRSTPVSIAGAVKTFCAVSAGGSHSLAIDKNGKAWAWGNNIYGQLGDNSTTSRLTPVSIAGAAKTFCAINAGGSHSLAIDKNGRLWAWGINSQGQLGDNSITSRLTPVRVFNI
jgi:alpha-tubulin suppressor-like RCC1 family protein